MTSVARFGRTARFVFMASSCATLVACHEGPLAPRGSIAFGERELLFEALVTMLLVVIPVLVLALGVAWWFRASNTKARYLADWEYSGKIEFTIWMIPLLVVTFLGTLAWVGAHAHDPYRPLRSDKPVVTIQVISLDWKWVFIYPDQRIATVNALVIPVDQPIHFELTSGTVMNSFSVPQLAGQIYTMSGMRTQLWLQASHQGVYKGFSAQFSGDGFSDMHFDAQVVSAADFSKWVDQVRSGQEALTSDSYRRLASTQSTAPPSVYAQVVTGLFDSVVMASMGASATPRPEGSVVRSTSSAMDIDHVR